MIKKPRTSLYAQPADVYDAMMSTALETSIFVSVSIEAERLMPKDKQVSVVDMCCGTGIVARMLARHKKISYTGVDINATYLRDARRKLRQFHGFVFLKSDALTYAPKKKVDIVILTSAYHHIVNKNKVKLLQNIYNMLKDDARLLLYEKVIRAYSSRKEFQASNEEFYLRRIEYLQETEKRHLSKQQHEALLNICGLSASGNEEYKVSYRHLIEDLKMARLEIVSGGKLWPEEDIFGDPEIGDFVFVVKKRA